MTETTADRWITMVAGIRRRIAARVVAELDDHAESLRRDLEAGGLSPEGAADEARSRLGTTQDLVAAVAADRDALTLSRGRPWLVFGVGPFVAAALTFGAISLATIGDVAISVPCGRIKRIQSRTHQPRPHGNRTGQSCGASSGGSRQ